mgnify:CR=1 FL=1
MIACANHQECLRRGLMHGCTNQCNCVNVTFIVVDKWMDTAWLLECLPKECALFGSNLTITLLWGCHVTMMNRIKAFSSLIIVEKETRLLVLLILVLWFWCLLPNKHNMVSPAESTMWHKTWCDSCGSTWIHTCNVTRMLLYNEYSIHCIKPLCTEHQLGW